MFAENDLNIVKNPGETRIIDVDDRTTSSEPATLKPGEPVIIGGAGTNFATRLLNGAPIVNSERLAGIVRKESTETSSANGKVEVTTILPYQSVIRGTMNTAGNCDTAAELLGIMYDWITFDWDATNYTIDENEGTDHTTRGLCVVAGDIGKTTLDVIVHDHCVEGGSL